MIPVCKDRNKKENILNRRMKETCYFFADREVDRLAVWQERERKREKERERGK